MHSSKGKKSVRLAIVVGISVIILLFSTAVAASPVLRMGSRGKAVSDLQTKLKNMGFFQYARITAYYGSITKNAVIRFQTKKGLAPDGIAGPKTLAALGTAYAQMKSAGADAGYASISINQLLKQGTRGAGVKTLQSILKDIGYYRYSVDGIFGPITRKATMNFQKAVGIKVDGIVGRNTISKLESITDAKTTALTRSGTSRTSYALLPWFGSVQNIFKRNDSATVLDVDTGIRFKVRRTGGYNHADSETLTAKDTALMKKIYRGKWSWTRRAIVIEVDGYRIAASMAGMPHAFDRLAGNGMTGHFDIHFLNSRTHGTNRVDEQHQAMVQKAARYLLTNN